MEALGRGIQVVELQRREAPAVAAQPTLPAGLLDEHPLDRAPALRHPRLPALRAAQVPAGRADVAGSAVVAAAADLVLGPVLPTRVAALPIRSQVVPREPVPDGRCRA